MAVKHCWLQIILFVITNMISAIQLTLVTDSTAFQYPVFTECNDNRYCKKRMEASGSFTCVIRHVNSDVRLSVITNSSELNIYFQKESVITTDGVSDVSLKSNFSTQIDLSECNSEFMATCKALDRGNSSIQIGSTAQLGILIDCSGERPLSIEEKVWLAAITLFPFLWVFTLVIVCYMNKRNISKLCRHHSIYTRSGYNSERIRQTWLNSARRMSLTQRPRLVEDIDGEKNDNSIAYVFFTDDRSCYAVDAKAPHKTVKLVLEKKIGPGRKEKQAATNQQTTSETNRDDIELVVLETVQDSSVQESLLQDSSRQDSSVQDSSVQDNSVQDSSTPERTDDQKQNFVADDLSRNSVTELETKAIAGSNEALEGGLEWCRCGRCQELPEKSKVCCRRTYGECVTDDTLFYQLVTDRNTLQAAMIQWNDKQVRSRFQAMAYKEYVYWQMGVTQNYSKIIIPSCVIQKVQARYPNDSFVSSVGFTI